jgi:CBS domain-containing protein
LGVANILIDRVDGLSAIDVMHAQTSALGPETTIGEARAYFAASTSRRLAVLTEAGRYLGALTPSDLPGEGEDDRPLLEVLEPRPTVGAGVPAATARDLALSSDARRVPVVGDDGRYLGIVSVNRTGEWFCGTG